MSQGSEGRPGDRPAEIQPSVSPETVQQVARQTVHHLVGAQFQIGPAPNAIIEKLQPEHLTAVIGNADKEGVRHHLRLIIFYVTAVVGFLILCALFLFSGHHELLINVLTYFATFIGGFGTGYGYLKAKVN
jgi:hypothetical protein